MFPYLYDLYSELRCKDTKYFFMEKENTRKSFFERKENAIKVLFRKKIIII